MSIVRRMLIKRITLSVGLCILILMVLQIFMLLLNQITSIGKGDYGFGDALLYSMLMVPSDVYRYFPMACLLGSLIALGGLAEERALIILGASGFSKKNLFSSVALAACALMIVSFFLGETIGPYSENLANTMKMEAISSGKAHRTSRGVWLKLNDAYVLIGEMTNPKRLEHVTTIVSDGANRFQSLQYSPYIEQVGAEWQAHQVVETSVAKDGVHYERKVTAVWPYHIPNVLVDAIALEPDEMSLLRLFAYIKDMSPAIPGHQAFFLNFWQRVSKPFTILIMTFFAIPFIMGPLREASMGLRVLAGALAGFGFFILYRVVGLMSQIYHFSPLFAAVMPSLVFAGIALVLIRRIRA